MGLRPFLAKEPPDVSYIAASAFVQAPMAALAASSGSVTLEKSGMSSIKLTRSLQLSPALTETISSCGICLLKIEERRSDF